MTLDMDFIRRDMFGFLTIIICLILAGLLAIAETAITSLGSLKAKQLLDQSKGDARHLQLWLHHPSKILTTILVYVTAMHILASAISTTIATRYFQDTGIGIATGVMTLLILVFCEIIPKSFAKANADKVGPIALQIVYITYKLSYPLIFVFAEIAHYTLRKLAFNKGDVPPITEEEVEYLVNVGKKAGVFGDIKKEMISGVFEFDETKVREIMTPRTDIIAMEAATRIEESLKIAVEGGHSRIPVFDKRIDNIVGIVLAKDLLQFTVDRKLPPEARITKIMRQPFFTPESKPIMDVFKELKRTKNHMAIVIDEYGGTAGLVTMEDILEEIVGEIQDEFDAEEAAISELSPGLYEVMGSMNIDEFFEFFDMDNSLGEDRAPDVDTIAGWLTQMQGHMPQTGQSITVGPLKILVTQVQRHRIRKLKVQRLEMTPGDSTDG